MESHPIEAAALPLPQTVVSPALQCSSPGGLCAKPRDRMKTPAFLSNLGKPTLRGIRKCPQCGIYNGTRGLSCKNKACGAIFRDGTSAGARRSVKKGGGGGSEVVRIVTDGGGGGPFMDGGSGGSSSSSSSCSSSAGAPQMFSLRQRGRGPEQRGFVELTLTDTAIATTDGTLLTRLSLGRCFLPACRRQQQQQQQGQRGVPSSSSPPCSSSSSSQASDSPCGHVRQAMECPPGQVATPLLLKSSVLDELPISAQIRQELWRLANDTPGPLVQRVSRNSLVVKCHTNETQVLGLLHCTVGGAGVKSESGGVVFRCACQQGAGGVGGRGPSGVRPSSLGSLNSSDDKETELVDGSGPLSPPAEGATQCLHFYACVCAFASDDNLAVEFAHFLNCSPNGILM